MSDRRAEVELLLPAIMHIRQHHSITQTFGLGPVDLQIDLGRDDAYSYMMTVIGASQKYLEHDEAQKATAQVLTDAVIVDSEKLDDLVQMHSCAVASMLGLAGLSAGKGHCLVCGENIVATPEYVEGYHRAVEENAREVSLEITKGALQGLLGGMFPDDNS